MNHTETIEIGLIIKDNIKCPICLEIKRGIQNKCNICIECFKLIGVKPIFPYPEIEKEYFNDTEHIKWKNYPLIYKYKMLIEDLFYM